MGEHAKFSPSAAARWKKCPASVRESENAVSADTDASLQGTAMHWAYAMALMGTPVEPGATAPNGIKLTTEMLEDIVGPAVGWVRRYLDDHKSATSVMVEERVQIGTFFDLDASLLWGTADTLILEKTELVVVDLKAGYVDVQAEENEQLILYALGAAEELGWLWDKYRLVILQPKQGEPKEWEITREELLKYAEEFREPIANALSDSPRYVPSEEGCRFCPAAARCQKLHEEAIVLAKREFEEPTEVVKRITVEQMVQLLDKADLIRGVLAAVEEHALKLLQLGQEVPGYKMVEGRKNRVWKAGAEEKLKVLLGEEAYKKTLITPAQAEKKSGIRKDGLADLIEKPRGEARLAPVSDKRPALPPHFDEVDFDGVLS